MTDRRLLEAALRRREQELLSLPWKRLPRNPAGNPSMKARTRRNLLPRQLDLLQWGPDGQTRQARRP